jgi:hypothetical protein
VVRVMIVSHGWLVNLAITPLKLFTGLKHEADKGAEKLYRHVSDWTRKILSSSSADLNMWSRRM